MKCGDNEWQHCQKEKRGCNGCAYNDKSKSDEIFEELGYKKYDNHPEFDKPISSYTFATQDVRHLYYEQKAVEHIEFDLFSKNVVCYALLNEKMTVVPLSLKELEAINEKVKELGWLNE